MEWTVPRVSLFKTNELAGRGETYDGLRCLPGGQARAGSRGRWRAVGRGVGGGIPGGAGRIRETVGGFGWGEGMPSTTGEHCRVAGRDAVGSSRGLKRVLRTPTSSRGQNGGRLGYGPRAWRRGRMHKNQSSRALTGERRRRLGYVGTKYRHEGSNAGVMPRGIGTWEPWLKHGYPQSKSECEGNARGL